MAKNFLSKLLNPNRYIEGFNLKQFKETKMRLCFYCPWGYFVEDGVVFLKAGALLRSYIFSCPDLESSSASSINTIATYFNNALKQLGTGWAVQLEVQRYKTRDYPGARFDNRAAFIIDKKREKNFKRFGEHFASSYYISFTQELKSDIEQKSKKLFLRQKVNKKNYHAL